MYSRSSDDHVIVVGLSRK